MTKEMNLQSPLYISELTKGPSDFRLTLTEHGNRYQNWYWERTIKMAQNWNIISLH